MQSITTASIPSRSASTIRRSVSGTAKASSYSLSIDDGPRSISTAVNTSPGCVNRSRQASVWGSCVVTGVTILMLMLIISVPVKTTNGHVGGHKRRGR